MMKPSSSRRRPRQKPSLRSWQLARIAQPVNEGEPPLPDSARSRTGTSTRQLRAKFAPGGGRLFFSLADMNAKVRIFGIVGGLALLGVIFIFFEGRPR